MNFKNRKFLEEIYIEEKDYLIRCDICLEYENYEQNTLLNCEICNVSVHKFCLGTPVFSQFNDTGIYI